MSVKLERHLSKIDNKYPEISREVRGAIPDLSVPAGIDLLRQRGLDILPKETIQSLKPKRLELEQFTVEIADLLTCLISEMPQCSTEYLTRIITGSRDAIDLALTLIFEPPKGFDICRRNPMAELPQFAKLLLNSRVLNTAVPIVLPVCPDVEEGYVVGDDIGFVIHKALRAIPIIQKIFEKHGFKPCFELHLADVEAIDPIILRKSGESTESYLRKTAQTVLKTKQLIQQLALRQVSIKPMSSIFLEHGQDYLDLQQQATQKFSSTEQKKILQTIFQLIKERIREGDFSETDEATQRQLVEGELAGYAAYGSLIKGEAIIMSPDAMSAVPAYQFLVEKESNFSPVIYVK